MNLTISPLRIQPNNIYNRNNNFSKKISFTSDYDDDFFAPKHPDEPIDLIKPEYRKTAASKSHGSDCMNKKTAETLANIIDEMEKHFLLNSHEPDKESIKTIISTCKDNYCGLYVSDHTNKLLKQVLK